MRTKKNLLIASVSVLLGGVVLPTGLSVYAAEIDKDTVTDSTTSTEGNDSITVEDDEFDADFDTYIQEIIFNDDVVVPEVETEDDDTLLTEEEQNEIINSIVTEVQDTTPVNTTVRGGIQTRAAAGLMAKLAAKYGTVWLKKTAPKFLYKKISFLIGKKISQAKFVQIFGRIINLATGTAMEQALAKSFRSLGISSKLANSAASIIVTGLFLLV
ncbi:hypothetical protein FM115_08850 [Marinilactibacillus psychrotolerans 42ea]|uniref:Uncharacterized protein n=1 Tax=Marinilactibacillus psychrotolerans 42ea TaxID=1255609 RepID=A0A1R4KAD6_9LACT|nr:hypothetical protein [Marinilactibacillus psychrotolerans]SJN41280.1 hypothetical protein FM115_08850 [Marinilactibacillus psychrotolerans 42ea]